MPLLEREGEFGVTSYAGEANFLQKLGFLVSPFFETFPSVELLAERVKRLSESKPKFDFDIDGLVIKFDDFSIWNDLGATEHHPRYAIAYKFPQEHVRTKVLDIEHSVGRS